MIFVVVWLTHWGRVTHICVGKLIIIGSGNGLSPDRHQAIIWTKAGLLSIGPLRTYFGESLIKIQFSLKKMHMKMSSSKWRPSCLGLTVLNYMSKLQFEVECDIPYLDLTNDYIRRNCGVITGPNGTIDIVYTTNLIHHGSVTLSYDTSIHHHGYKQTVNL